MKQLAITTLIILSTVALLVLLWVFRQVIILFVLSLAVAAATRPLADALIGKGLNRILSIMAVYLLVFSLFGSIIVLANRPFFSELEMISDQFAEAYDRAWTEWPTGTQLQQSIIQRMPPPQDLYEAITGEQGVAMAQAILGVTMGSFSVFSQFFAIIILSIYWSIDRVHFERLWLSIMPVETRARAREIWRDIENGVGSYLRSEVAQSILAGILLGAFFSLIGIPYPVLLALLASIFWLIPWLGAILAVIPVVIVGFFLTNLTLGIIAIAYTIAILLLMEVVIEPRIFKRSKYSSLLVVLAMIALADAFGLIGIVLAPPLAAAIQLLFRHLLQPSPPETQLESIRKIADLDNQLSDVENMVVDQAESVSPQTISMLDRLSQLVGNAKVILEKEQGLVPERKNQA